MKLKLLGVVSLALISSPALAQTTGNVMLYGIVDSGVEYLNHSNAAGQSTTRVPTLTAGQAPSRFGVRGSEDLGGGLKSIFTLESGFSPDTGSSGQGSRLFGRAAFVGLDSRWGAVTIGRQSTMTSSALSDADVMGAVSFSMAALDSYIAGPRTDNTVAYRGKFGGLTIGGTYSLGRDTTAATNCGGENPNDAQACRGMSGLIKYDGGMWGAAFSYDELRGGPGAAADTIMPGVAGVAFTSSSDKDRRYIADGYVKVAGAKIGGGLIHRSITTTVRDITTNLYFLGATVPFGSWTVDAQLARLYNPEFRANGTLAALRTSYNFSRGTAAYVSLARMGNSGGGSIYSVSSSAAVPSTPNPGQSQIGVLVGIRHSF